MIERLHRLRLDRRRWLQLPLLGSLGAAVVKPVQAQPVQAQPVLRVGFLHHYPPFSQLRDGQVQGFEVEVVQRLAQIEQVHLQVVAEGLGPLQKKLQDGQIDLIGNQLLATPENRSLFEFVRPFALNQLVCVQHEDDSRDFLSLDDLFGKRLGVLARTGIEAQARGVLGRTVVAYDRIVDGLRDLGERKLDAVLEESLIVEYHIEHDRLPIKVTAPFAPPLRMGMVLGKGQLALRERLTQAVMQTLRDGSFAQISKRWFGFDVSRSRSGHASSR